MEAPMQRNHTNARTVSMRSNAEEAPINSHMIPVIAAIEPGRNP